MRAKLGGLVGLLAVFTVGCEGPVAEAEALDTAAVPDTATGDLPTGGDVDDGTCPEECTAVNGTATCDAGVCTRLCDSGWEGDLCDEDIDECADSPCDADEECTNLDGGFICGCDPESDCGGVKAETFTSCTPNPCHRGAACAVGATTVTCTCPVGWSGSLCQIPAKGGFELVASDTKTTTLVGTCSAPVPATVVRKCPAGAVATGLSGRTAKTVELAQLQCRELYPDGTLGGLGTSPAFGTSAIATVAGPFACATGSALVGGLVKGPASAVNSVTGGCLTTAQISASTASTSYAALSKLTGTATDGTQGSSLCPNGYVATALSGPGSATPCSLSFQCTRLRCKAGYSGADCLTDINDCAPNPCKSGGTCTDGVNGFTCKCAAGFSGNTCQTNVDDCAPNPCFNGGTCKDGVATFTCTCKAGWIGEKCGVADCADACNTAKVSGTSCVKTPKSNGAACGDGDACTTGDACKAGVCVGTPKTCASLVDDCNDGVCSAGICSKVAKAGPCQDGSKCTIKDKCETGTCKPGAKLDCDDGEDCTIDSCKKSTGCAHTNVTGAPACEDGLFCTTGDKCLKGKCFPTALRACDDGNSCTVDACVKGAGCVHTNAAGPCSDGLACTGPDKCQAGACVPGPYPCNDNNPCTDDSCTEPAGCAHANALECVPRTRIFIAEQAFAGHASELHLTQVGTGAVTFTASGSLQLVSKDPLVSATAFLAGPQPIQGGFVATFRFKTVKDMPTGSDGALAFNVLGGDLLSLVPGDTAELGLNRRALSVSISMGAPAVIEVWSGGKVLGSKVLAGRLSDAVGHDVTLTHAGGKLSVSVDGATVLTAVPALLVQLGALRSDGTAFIGFTTRDTGTGVILASLSLVESCSYRECNDGNACTVYDKCAAGTCKTGPNKDCSDGDTCSGDSCSAGICSSATYGDCAPWTHVDVPSHGFTAAATQFTAASSGAGGFTGVNVNGDLRLTNDTKNTRGAAYLTKKVPVLDGFEATFDFIVSNQVSGGSGLSFVIHNDPAELLTAVKADQDGAGSGVAVAFPALGGHIYLLEKDKFSLGSFNTGKEFADGKVHTVVVRYAARKLTVVYDGKTALDNIALDLVSEGAVDASGRAWVGFTSKAHETVPEYHTIERFSFVETCSTASCDDDNLSTTSDLCKAGECIATMPVCSATENLALGGTATQSSTAAPSAACPGPAAAIDGSTTLGAACAFSVGATPAFWLLDLGAVKSVDRLLLTKSTTLAGGLSNFDVQVATDAAFTKVTRSLWVSGSGPAKLNVTVQAEGRYVRVQSRTTSTPLFIDEVEVIGCHAACDDLNPCTDDVPDPVLGCLHTANTLACDDGNACTTNDTCGGNVCVGGDPPNCDDGNLCTTDACAPATGCTNTNNTIGCDDDEVCTSGDVCKSGACAGVLLTCNDSEPCTADSCTLGVGCKNKKIESCINCTDATVSVCNDANVCTTDACSNPTNGKCKYTALTGGVCEDGNACTVSDKCSTGECLGTQKDCSDGNVCTNDNCNKSSGVCSNPSNSLTCSDGNACTTNDVCKSSACAGGKPPVCNDGKACTDDSCVPASGCKYMNDNTNSCQDGNPCTTSDKCTAGTCAGPGTKNCHDANPCTFDSCDPAVGCKNANYKPEKNITCNDNNVCTLSDFCSAGTCIGKSAKVCNDNDLCTFDSCAPVGGCVYTTLPASACDDGNLCTDDSCDPAKGCQNVANATVCDDDNPCTPDDVCENKDCVGSGIVFCGDDNPCTDDSCDPEVGCVNAPNSDPCDDEDKCTVGDKCLSGLCKSGAGSLACDDNNVSTIDVCSPTQGCVNSPKSTACADAGVVDPCVSIDANDVHKLVYKCGDPPQNLAFELPASSYWAFNTTTLTFAPTATGSLHTGNLEFASTDIVTITCDGNVDMDITGLPTFKAEGGSWPAVEGAAWSLDGPIHVSYGSGKWLKSEYFGPDSVPFCKAVGAAQSGLEKLDGLLDTELETALTNLCSVLAVEADAPFQDDRYYFALIASLGEVGLSMTTPGSTSDKEFHIPAGIIPNDSVLSASIKVVVDPLDPMFFLSVGGGFLKQATGDLVTGLSGGFSGTGQLEQVLADSNDADPNKLLGIPPCDPSVSVQSWFALPYSLNGGKPCYKNDVIVRGHWHAAATVNLQKAIALPLGVAAKVTLDVDRKRDGSIATAAWDAFTNGGNLEELFENVAETALDFEAAIDGTLRLVLEPPKPAADAAKKTKIFAALAKLTMDLGQAQAVISDEGLHFRGRTSKDPFAVIETLSFLKLPVTAEPPDIDVAGYYENTESWWFRFRGVNPGIPGMQKGSTCIVELGSDQSTLDCTANTVFGALHVFGTLDVETGDFSLCGVGDQSASMLAFNVGFTPTMKSRICLSQKAKVVTFDVTLLPEFHADSKATLASICGLADYEDPSAVLCPNTCVWYMPWTCLSYIPLIGDALQSLVDAGCSYAGMAIKAVGDAVVSACYAVTTVISNNVSAAFDIVGSIRVTVAAGNLVDTAGNLKPGVSLTFVGSVSLSASLTLVGHTLAVTSRATVSVNTSTGEASIGVQGLGAVCFNFMKFTTCQ